MDLLSHRWLLWILYPFSSLFIFSYSIYRDETNILLHICSLREGDSVLNTSLQRTLLSSPNLLPYINCTLKNLLKRTTSLEGTKLLNLYWSQSVLYSEVPVFCNLCNVFTRVQLWSRRLRMRICGRNW